MVIESRSIVSGATALALAGAGLWLCMAMFTPSEQTGSVEIKQLAEPAWAVEVKQMELEPTAVTKTASR